MTYRQQSQQFIALIGTAVITVYVCLAVIGWRLWPQLELYRQQLVTQAASTCGCQSYLGVTQLPYIAALLVAAGIVAMVAIGLAITKAVLTWWRTQRYELMLQQQLHHTSYAKNIPIHVIANAEPLAVCIGLTKPRIYMSQVLIDTLTSWELLAVLQHELSHAKHTDPLYRWLMSIIQSLVPFGRKLVQRGQALIELAADEVVVDEGQLQRVFVKLFSHNEPSANMAATFFSVLNCRVDRLLGKPINKPQVWPVIIAAVVLCSSLVVSYRALASEVEPDELQQCLQEQPICEDIMSHTPNIMTMIVYDD